VSGLALFGGTFDPIHNAHLAIAQAAAELCGLERILFIPSGKPPHRADGTFASFEDRYAMVQIACKDNPCFEPSRLEQGETSSYSIHTIERVLAQIGGPLHFLIGADAFAEIQTWHRWQGVVASVIFIVVSRPGAQYSVPVTAQVVRLEDMHLEISSSEIRRRLALAKFEDLPLPAGVSSYIQAHRLYQSPKLH